MGLSLVVKTGDNIMNGVFESAGIGEGAVGELMLREIAPAAFDVIQFGGVFRPAALRGSAKGARRGRVCRLAAAIATLRGGGIVRAGPASPRRADPAGLRPIDPHPLAGIQAMRPIARPVR
jgi:hypothetical protein